MRRIRGLALGTYYAKGAEAARATPNASQVRGLVYAVKDNRVPPNPKQPIQHRLHPIGRPVQVDRTNAIEYVGKNVHACYVSPRTIGHKIWTIAL